MNRLLLAALLLLACAPAAVPDCPFAEPITCDPGYYVDAQDRMHLYAPVCGDDWYLRCQEADGYALDSDRNPEPTCSAGEDVPDVCPDGSASYCVDVLCDGQPTVGASWGM